MVRKAKIRPGEVEYGIDPGGVECDSDESSFEGVFMASVAMGARNVVGDYVMDPPRTRNRWRTIGNIASEE